MRTLICLIINQANQNPRNASPQPSRDSGDSLLTLLQKLMIFLSVNKQLTERDVYGQPVQSQNQGMRQKLERKLRNFEVRVEGCPESHRLCFG